MLLKTVCKASFRTLTTKPVLSSKPTSVLAPLQQYAPTFYTNGDNIKPLYQPSDFYSHLKVNQCYQITWIQASATNIWLQSSILSAKERVFIAALYIGQSEQELVSREL